MRRCGQELLATRVVGDAAWRSVRSVRAPRSCTPQPPNHSRSYGPFNYAGAFTTESNRRFDGWLKGRNAASGIRDFESVRDVAAEVEGSALAPLHSRLSC
jgi:hypothetical protein